MLLLFFVIISIFLISKIDKRTNIVENSAIRMMLVDGDDKVVSEVHADTLNDVSCTFELSSKSSDDIIYEVAVVSNYKTKEFSINESNRKSMHKIVVPKSEEIITTKVLINFEPDNAKLNDCLIILTPTEDQIVMLSEYHIIRRFSIIDLNAPNDMKISDEITKAELSPLVIDNINISVLEEKKLLEITELELSKIYDGLEFAKVYGEILEIPIYYRVKERLKDTNIDSRNNVLVFAMIDNNVFPIFDGNNTKQFEVSFTESNMMLIQMNYDDKEEKEITFYCVNRPYTKMSDYSYYNDTMLWSNVFYSENFFVNSVISNK